MKLRRLLIGLVLAGMSSVTAFAAETEEKIDTIGGFTAASAVILGSAADVVAVAIDCGGTACTGGLYDTATLGDETAAKGKFEGGAAANGTLFVKFDAPIRFSTGITFVDDGNVDAITVYRRVP